MPRKPSKGEEEPMGSAMYVRCRKVTDDELREIVRDTGLDLSWIARHLIELGLEVFKKRGGVLLSRNAGREERRAS